MPVRVLRKRHASFVQKDYNGILKTDSCSLLYFWFLFLHFEFSYIFSKGESHNQRCAFIKLYSFHNFSLRFILKISQI